MTPTATPIRPWTPDQLVRANDGSRDARLSPKRICNRCQLRLGDVTEREMLDVQRGFPLRDVHHECPRCNGLHMLMLTPESRPIGWQASDGDPIVEYRVVCPHREDPERDCFVWDRCGCQVPDGFDAYSTEGQAWLARPCPGSPNGEHAWLAEFQIVACPQPGSCWHADAADVPDLAEDAGAHDPGAYALDAELDDDAGANWQVIDVAAWRRTQRDTSEPAPTG